MISHHLSCSAEYPEKGEEETKRMIIRVKMGKGEVMYQCVDCGAFEIVEEGL